MQIFLKLHQFVEKWSHIVVGKNGAIELLRRNLNDYKKDWFWRRAPGLKLFMVM